VLSAADQLLRIEGHLLQTGGNFRDPPVGDTDAYDQAGWLRLVLDYDSGHRLYVNVALEVWLGYPFWPHYSFHLQDALGECVFRYDNSPHHPELPTFPHHKHVGSQQAAQGSALPTIREIVSEVSLAVGRVAQP
jgi:Family of unknown function (DUF6516)